MKISLVLAALILLVGIFFGIHRHQELQTLTEKLAALEVEAGRFNIPTDPAISFDSDRVRAENSREARKETVKALAREMITFYQNSGVHPPEDLADQVSKLSPEELRFLLKMIADDPSLEDSLKILGSWFPLYTLSKIDARAALTYAVYLTAALGSEESKCDIRGLFVGYSRSDPFEAAQWYLDNKDQTGVIDNEDKEYLLMNAAYTDPTAALALVKPLNPTDKEAAFREIGRRVTKENVHQFIEALRDQNEKYGQSKTAPRAITDSALMKNFETATALLSSPDLTLREHNILTQSLSYENIKERPTEWLSWLETHEKNEELQIDVTSELVRQWAHKDFAAAGEWLNTQPDGARKTQAIKSYAEALAPPRTGRRSRLGRHLAGLAGA